MQLRAETNLDQAKGDVYETANDDGDRQLSNGMAVREIDATKQIGQAPDSRMLNDS